MNELETHWYIYFINLLTVCMCYETIGIIVDLVIYIGFCSSFLNDNYVIFLLILLLLLLSLIHHDNETIITLQPILTGGEKCKDTTSFSSFQVQIKP